MKVKNLSLVQINPLTKFGLVDMDTGKILVEITKVFGSETYRVGMDTYISLSFAEEAARDRVRKML